MVCPGANSMHNRGSNAKEVTIMAKDEEATIEDINAANDAVVITEAQAAAIAKEQEGTDKKAVAMVKAPKKSAKAKADDKKKAAAKTEAEAKPTAEEGTPEPTEEVNAEASEETVGVNKGHFKWV